MNFRQILYYALSILLATGIVLLWNWQPERQVERHTLRFLDQAESKDWEDMVALIGEEYSDRWGHDRAAVVERSRQVLQQFFILEIEPSEVEITEENWIGTARAKLRLTGRGGPLAEYAVDRVAALTQPFTFTWRQRSWKPWDWVLVSVNQPELEVFQY